MPDSGTAGVYGQLCSTEQLLFGAEPVVHVVAVLPTLFDEQFVGAASDRLAVNGVRRQGRWHERQWFR